MVAFGKSNVLQNRSKVLQNAPTCNTFDLHQVIIGLENQFCFFFFWGGGGGVTVLQRFYCLVLKDRKGSLKHCINGLFYQWLRPFDHLSANLSFEVLL